MAPTGKYCDGCVNQPHGEKRILPSGDGSNGIMLVGDSPWKSEIIREAPFAGEAGKWVDRQLARLGLSRSQFTITNSMWCRPPHLGWTDKPHMFPEVYSALRQCEPYLLELIQERNPKVIVAMGGVAIRQTLSVTASVESRHSYVSEGISGIPTIATYHPSAIMQGKHKLTPCWMFALRRAQEVASGRFEPTRLDLVLDPSVDDCRGYLRRHLELHGGKFDLLMVDIETPESAKLDEEELEEAGVSYHIDRAGWSCCRNHGISFPFTEGYIDILKEAIGHAEIVAEWADNHFDTRRLRAAGIPVPGRVVSGMWAWHFLQSDLLKGLGFVAPFYYAGPPFKQLASVSPALYNGMDNAIGRLCTVGALDGLAAEGRLDKFWRHCVDADQILVRMGSAGVNIDEAQQQRFMGRLQSDVDREAIEIDQLVPATYTDHGVVRRIRQVLRWKNQPKDMTGVSLIANVPEPRADWKQAMEVVVASKGTVTDKQYKQARKMVNELRNPYRYERTLPFNVNAPEQIKDLIRSFGLKVPKVRGEDRETTESKHLKRFGKTRPVFIKILQCKQKGKLLSTYNWKLMDGLVFTTFGFHPSTLRKSSRNVNMQNIPKRSELADEFRRMIVAPPGYMLIESDASAIEAVLVGYDGGSDRYIRLSKAGLHGWMTSAYNGQPISLELPFDELQRLCKAAKKKWPEDYEVLKRVGHMSNYRGSPMRIWEEYPDEFESVTQAAKMQGFYFGTEPGQDVVRWQHVKMEQAAKQRYLLNHFGYKHYFYQIFKWDDQRKADVPDDEGDAKRAVAFVPQSDASAIQTEVLLRLAEGYPGMLDCMRLVIHDSTILLVPEDDVEERATQLHTEMIRPIPELPMKDGSLLSIGAETKCGRNLGSYHPERNPGGMQEMMVEVMA